MQEPIDKSLFTGTGTDSASFGAQAEPPRHWNYNPSMARGWESKSVEAQQAEASDKTSPARSRLTPEAAARVRDYETLRLTRQRVLQQLERATNPRHRQLLQDELSALDDKLKQFQS